MNYHIYYNKKTGKKVQTIVKATAVPSMQDVICFQELFDEFDFLVMSREQFMQEFERELEGIPQKSRKEIEKRDEIPEKIKRIETKVEEELGENKRLFEFLDAKTYKEKIDLFLDMKEELDERMLNNIAACLDISLEDGEDQVEHILNHLELQAKYEMGERMR